MTENKTKATEVSVDAHLAAIADPQRRADCEVLRQLLQAITGEKAKMWGPTIVGFGSYHYRYESGREGDMCIVGFAARGRETVIYIDADTASQQALLGKLGKHRIGKSCLYLRRLDEVDRDVLEALIRGSIAETRRRYG